MSEAPEALPARTRRAKVVAVIGSIALGASYLVYLVWGADLHQMFFGSSKSLRRGKLPKVNHGEPAPPEANAQPANPPAQADPGAPPR